MAIVYRVAKGSPLTNAEVDANFLHLDTIKANKTITVTGTSGLTGGGDLSANRTLALGTPSTLTVSSTNSASGSTHNHALDLSGRSIIAGNGLVGGGGLNSDRTLSIGTPSTLTATTTNSTTTTSHTHNIEATTSRTSSSTTAFLIAKGMNDHRVSSDHDNRYGAVQQQLGIELGRDYNSGSIINVYRIGRQVTIWWNSSLNFPDQGAIRSNAILPAWAIPVTNLDYIADVRGGLTGGAPDGTIRLIQVVRVNNNGEFQVMQFKTETSIRCFPSAVTYIVPE